MCEDLKLVKPSMEWEASYRSMIEERQAADSDRTGYAHRGVPDNFSELVKRLEDQEQGIYSTPGLVPQSTFWLVRDDKEIIGESRLRHYLTPSLENIGGHIGYLIHPSERRKGYGTKILALTMEKAREIGIDRVLITCRAENIGSARIIEKNGGKQDSDYIDPDGDIVYYRYWIDL